ncbi:HDOD domain-containing protein [Thalassotalea ganghwensis]
MRVVIVDNSERELTPLSLAFNSKQCTVAYFDDVLIALKKLSTIKFDAIISLDSLGSTTGTELFKVLSLKYPQVIRIGVQSLATVPLTLKAQCHYLYGADTAPVEIVDKLLAIAENQKKITREIIVKSVAEVKNLPSPPKIYLQLNALLNKDTTDAKKIAGIIAQDPALSAKVLQISNGSTINKGKPLTCIAEAVAKMGLELLSCVVMTAELFSYQPNIPQYSIIGEQLHSLATAKLAASMVKPELRQITLLASLLHDIGKVVLYEMDEQLTQTYFNHRSNSSDNLALERQVFGTDHCQVGGYLLHCWNFPYEVISLILYHHTPKQLLTSDFGSSQALYLANCLLNEREPHQQFLKHFNLLPYLEKFAGQAKQLKAS